MYFYIRVLQAVYISFFYLKKKKAVPYTDASVTVVSALCIVTSRFATENGLKLL